MFSDAEKLRFLGEGLYLFASSPRHHGYSVAQLATFLSTPIKLNQFRLYRTEKQQPVGFVAWAYLNEEAAEGYRTGTRALRPIDWDAGKQLWIIEFIAPFGHASRIIRDLRTNIFPRSTAHTIRYEMPEMTPRVVCYAGVHVKRELQQRTG